MARFGMGRTEMADSDKLHAAISRAVSEYDFDSGWVGLTSGRVVRHRLGILPKTVRVFVSDKRTGEGFESEGFSNCTLDEVTVGGAKAYARVLVNR